LTDRVGGAENHPKRAQEPELRSEFSPREVGKALGVSESSVKRWIDDGVIAASRTVGGHRRVTLREVVRFIRTSAMPVVRPEVLGLVVLETVRHGHPTLGPENSLRQALLEGREEAVRAIVMSQYLAGSSPAAICDGPIAGAMHGIGELWPRHPRGVVIEHRATDLCIQALGLLRALIPLPREGAPNAVGGAPAGDPYLLPSSMSSLVLAGEGWHAANLGPDLPFEDLVLAAEEEHATLAWLSVGSEAAGERLAREIAPLAERLARAGVRLVVGGRALPRSLETRDRPYVVGRSMAELVAFARGLAG
jgi:MerR family transcriptional regulator, light-induced transcriptional regulator